jgi:hypothetical protein
MKKNLLTGIVLITVTLNVFGQDTLFYENFETVSNSFLLNTTDVNSTSSGYNHWVINNEYAGGSGNITCIIPTTFTVPNTNAQPSSITGSPNSYYMHIVSDAAVNSGINCCCFFAANGLCNNAERYFAGMNGDMNTMGFDTVTLSFWWLCNGANNDFGEVYYSIDAGISWTLITTPFQKYNNHSNWVNQVISLPAFVAQNTLRFGFRFVNQVSTTATDPGFGLDEIVVTKKTNLLLPTANFNASDTSACEGSCINFTDLTGNGPTSWEWHFPGALPDSSVDQNPLQICYSLPGTYDVTLIASNSNGSDTLTLPNYITINSNPSPPNITVSNDTLCSSSAFTYQWYADSVLISGATNQCYYPGQIGNYYVLITDPNGCTATSNSVNTGIEELNIGDELRIYPNPSNGVFNLVLKNNFIQEGELTITDITGRVIYKDAINENRKSNFTIDLGKKTDAVYFLSLKSAKMVLNKKLLLNK